MHRLLFEKTGSAVWISHLDLMRVFQRAFKRAGLYLTHTKGFNPRPSVSIALPLSVGIESRCELLDFELEGEPVPNYEIRERLNACLIPGVFVREVYSDFGKIKNLVYLDCCLTLEYDSGIPAGTVDRLVRLFSGEEVVVDKRSKNGIVDQNIIPMIKKLEFSPQDENTLLLNARICCQNPTLNPMQLSVAIERYLPELKPSFVKCCRKEILDAQEQIFR